MVEAGGSREAAEVQGRSNFGSGKSAAATVIWHVWQERVRVGRREHRQRRVGARKGTLVCWDRDR